MNSLLLTLLLSVLSLFCLSLWQKVSLLEELSYAKCSTEQDYYRFQDLCAYAHVYHTLKEDFADYTYHLTHWPENDTSSPYSAKISTAKALLSITLFKEGRLVKNSLISIKAGKK